MTDPVPNTFNIEWQNSCWATTFCPQPGYNRQHTIMSAVDAFSCCGMGFAGTFYVIDTYATWGVGTAAILGLCAGTTMCCSDVTAAYRYRSFWERRSCNCLKSCLEGFPYCACFLIQQLCTDSSSFNRMEIPDEPATPPAPKEMSETIIT